MRTRNAMQLKAYALIKSLFIETNPMPVKAAMNMMGLEVGPVRPPLCELLPENEDKLRKVCVLFEIGFHDKILLIHLACF